MVRGRCGLVACAVGAAVACGETFAEDEPGTGPTRTFDAGADSADTDATTDGGSAFCTGYDASFFCTDFDESDDPASRWTGPAKVVGDGSVTITTDHASSKPHAMRATLSVTDGGNGTFVSEARLVRDLAANASSYTASFDVTLGSSAGAKFSEVALLELTDTTPATQYAALGVVDGGRDFVLRGTTSALVFRDTSLFVGDLGKTYRVTLVLDLAPPDGGKRAATVTVHVDGDSGKVVELDQDVSGAASKLSVKLGLATRDVMAMDVFYDDVVMSPR